MTSKHIERYAELGGQILGLKVQINRASKGKIQDELLAQLNVAILERNDLWDAIEFGVPEIE